MLINAINGTECKVFKTHAFFKKIQALANANLC